METVYTLYEFVIGLFADEPVMDMDAFYDQNATLPLGLARRLAC